MEFYSFGTCLKDPSYGVGHHVLRNDLVVLVLVIQIEPDARGSRSVLDFLHQSIPESNVNLAIMLVHLAPDLFPVRKRPGRKLGEGWERVDEPFAWSRDFCEIVDDAVYILDVFVIPIGDSATVGNLHDDRGSVSSRMIIQFFWRIQEIDAHLACFVHLDGLIVDGLGGCKDRVHDFA